MSNDIIYNLKSTIKSFEMRINELKCMYDEDGELNEGLDRVWIMEEIKYLNNQIKMFNTMILKEELKNRA